MNAADKKINSSVCSICPVSDVEGEIEMGFSRFACCFKGQLVFGWVHTKFCRQQAEPYLTRAKTVDIDGRRFKKLIRPRCPESIMETSELEPPRFKCWPVRRRVILFFFFFFSLPPPPFFFLSFFSFFLRLFISALLPLIFCCCFRKAGGGGGGVGGGGGGGGGGGWRKRDVAGGGGVGG